MNACNIYLQDCKIKTLQEGISFLQWIISFICNMSFLSLHMTQCIRCNTNLIYRSEITMSISKCWVDLNSSCVALYRAIYILHLFQSISHVGVCISKCWMNSNCFFVMNKCFMQFSLLLQYTSQVRMSCCKLREDLRQERIYSINLPVRVLESIITGKDPVCWQRCPVSHNS